MIDKKFFSILLLSALLVAFCMYGKKGVDGSADDGKKPAQELRDCFTNAGSDDAKVACIEKFHSQAQKWKDEDVTAFETKPSS